MTQIQEFLNNADSKVVNEMQDEMIKLRSQAQVKPITLKSTEEQVKKLMKKNITHNSYKHWRKRVKLFSDRRKHYK